MSCCKYKYVQLQVYKHFNHYNTIIHLSYLHREYEKALKNCAFLKLNGTENNRRSGLFN